MKQYPIPVVIDPAPDGVIMLHIPPDITDSQIDESIKCLWDEVVEKNQGCVAAFGGYDDDERELYNIPEVAILCKRLVDRGFISLLWPSTLLSKKERPDLGGFFGAFEVWAISKNMFTYEGTLDVEIKVFNDFVHKVLVQSNEICDATVRGGIVDGQHRTRIIQ